MSNNFESLIPEHILRLQPYVAGRPIWEVQKEFGLTDVVKLASNENSLGPSPMAFMEIVKNMGELHRYPDTAGLRLRTALADIYNVKVDNIILGSGSEGIMSYIMRTFLDQDDEVVSVNATFVGFTVMANSRATPPVLVPLKDHRFDLESIAEHITERTKIVYLCNPNNPTGTFFTKPEWDRFLAALPPRVLVICDEAYFEFAQDHPDYPDSMLYRHDQVITLRTFSKAYGLAGIRIGYGIAHEYLIKNLMKIKLPFEPSSLAQAAGYGALLDQDFLKHTLEVNRLGASYFYQEFHRLGLKYYPTAANFIMLVFDSEEEVNKLSSMSLQRGLIIRPLRNFGLPNCVRISIGTMPECQECIRVLEEVLNIMRNSK